MDTVIVGMLHMVAVDVVMAVVEVVAVELIADAQLPEVIVRLMSLEMGI